MLCMICKSDVNETESSCPNCGASPWQMPERFLNADQHQAWLNEVYNPQLERWKKEQNRTSDYTYKPRETYMNKDVKSLNMKWLKERARFGDNEAQYELARRYFHGKKGAKVDKRKAYEWYLAVAENEFSLRHDAACFFVAECLFHGHGVEKNQEQAALLYQSVVEHNGHDHLEDAQYMYAYCCYNAMGVSQDYNLAYYYFNLVYRSKYANIAYYWYENLFMLAECYYHGRGVEQNYDTAFQLYLKYIDFSHIIDGTRDSKRPHTMLGNCYYQLGECYLTGKGVHKDFSEAVYYYELARSNGHQVEKGKLRMARFKSIFKSRS